MKLAPNICSANFKALYISPSGQEALDNAHKGSYWGFNLRGYIESQQKQMADYKYVDGIFIGKPNEYGHYYPVLYIRDKLTGESLKEPFSADSTNNWQHHIVKTEDGRKVPENVAVLKDSKGNRRYFSYITRNGAEGFIKCARGGQPFNCLNLGVIDAMEDYYTNRMENDTIRDKYIDLLLLLRERYGKQMHQIVPEIIKEENLLGSGREKDVYKIDKMPEYALCVIRDKYSPDKQISPFRQCFQITSVTDNDLPIIMNNNGMYIKKCIAGKSHSLPNWGKKINGAEPLIYEDIKYFMNSLKELSEFPVLSYVNFAKALQKLNDEFPSVRIDIMNPNNIIIDRDLQTIKIIDFGSKDNKPPLGTVRPVNGLSDMEAILCDSMMYTRYYDMANDEDKKKLDEYAKNIIKNCAVAAKVTDIGNYPLNTELYVEEIDKKFHKLKDGSTGLERLRAFKIHFKDFLSKKIVSSSRFCHFEEILKKTERSFEDEYKAVLKEDENISSNDKNDVTAILQRIESEEKFEKILSQLPKGTKHEIVQVYDIPKKDSFGRLLVKKFKGRLYPITKFFTRKKCIKVEESEYGRNCVIRDEFYSDGTSKKMMYKTNGSLTYMLEFNKKGTIKRIVEFDWSWHGVYCPNYRADLDVTKLLLRLCRKCSDIIKKENLLK